MKKPKPGSAEAALRSHALSYPEAREDFPWGERVIKVRGKVFAFLGRPEDGLSLSVKSRLHSRKGAAGEQRGQLKLRGEGRQDHRNGFQSIFGS